MSKTEATDDIEFDFVTDETAASCILLQPDRRSSSIRSGIASLFITDFLFMDYLILNLI